MKPVLTFPCYEPASGFQLEFTEAEILQHTLIIGTTGCGKTTLLTSAIKQLIAHESRPGLLILDAKAEGMIEQIRADALRSGREHDVVVFGPQGDAAFDLFSAGDADRVTRRLMLAVEAFNQDNAFWHQSTTAMLNAAIVLVRQVISPVTFEHAVERMRQWFMSAHTPDWVTFASERLVSAAAPHPIGATLDQVKLWETLESRTRSNVQSCLLQVLRPLMAPQAAACFLSREKPALTPALSATAGKICVISIPALTEPELAKLFFRIGKLEFFEAVQSRREPPHHLCGLIADEFPLVATEFDVAHLGTVRSKRCAVLAATQGLDSLTQRLGAVASRAVVNHFNNVVYMRCREMETAVSAFITLGSKRERPPAARETEWRDTRVANTPGQPEIEVPVCPVGALARLSPHQAFVIQADGRRTLEPVWFVPWFELLPATPATSATPVSGPTPKFTSEQVLTLMQEAGSKLRWSAEVILAVAALRRRRHRRILKQATSFFLKTCFVVPEGLETMPEQWLAALPGILKRWAAVKGGRLPFTIRRTKIAEGVLLLEFGAEPNDTAGAFSEWNQVHISVNRAVYPSRWRPLSQFHWVKLRQLHPELRLTPDGQSPTV